jgi:hypothetical protein
MDRHEILRRLYTTVTVDVPFTGAVLGGMARNPSYDAANSDALGVPVIEVGGKKRCASADILQKLGLPVVPTPEMATALRLTEAPPAPPAPESPPKLAACDAKPMRRTTARSSKSGRESAVAT